MQCNIFNKSNSLQISILCWLETLFNCTEQKLYKKEHEVIVLSLNLFEMGKLSENSSAKICH